jgi:hypothetical protein
MKALRFIAQLPFSRRQRHALQSRDGVTRDHFVSELAADDIEASAAGLLWDKLVQAAVISDFRPMTDDNFLHLYGLADEDLDDDLISEILIKLNLPLPSATDLSLIGNIDTPKDFMKLVHLAIAK